MEGSDEPQASSSSTGSSSDEISPPDQSVNAELVASETFDTTVVDDSTEDMEIEGDQSGFTAESEGGNMEVHLDDPSEPSEDMGMEAGPSNPGKRVKVTPLILIA
jgi:hypothetical protein